VRGQFLASRDGLPHSAHEFFRVIDNQPIRDSQQAYAKSSQVVFFLGVSPHLTGLRVNPSIKFDRQSTFKAVEIHHPVFQAALAAEFGAQPSAAQQIPCRSFGVSLVAPQFADAFGWEAHGESIAAWT
jgi:hypothetical protein